MILTVIGAALALLGAPFFLRGLTLSLWPEGRRAQQVRERNLRKGLETDMKLWGRRVRRFGALLLILGSTLVAVGQLS